MIRTLLLFSFLFFNSCAQTKPTSLPSDFFALKKNPPPAIETAQFDPKSKGLSQIFWFTAPIHLEKQNGLNYVHLEGMLKSPAKKLTLNGYPLDLDAAGNFKVSFGFSGNEKNFSITLTDLKGISHTGSYRIIKDKSSKSPPSTDSQ